MSNTSNCESAESIIDSARRYREESQRRMNYNDYNKFKQQLIDAGFYGHEKELADALRL